MTFEKWWKDNFDIIWKNGGLAGPTRIKESFEACWHDGFRTGYSSENKKPAEDLSHTIEFTMDGMINK